MPSLFSACLIAAITSAGLVQTGACQAQQLPTVPGPPSVPAPPRSYASPGTSGLQSGLGTYRQNPVVGRTRGFDEGGIGSVPGADSSTQSTNATNATSATGGEGFSNRRR